MRVAIVLALIVCFAFAAVPKFTAVPKPAPLKTVTKPVKVIPTSVPSTPRPREIEVSCAFQGDPHIRTPFAKSFDFYEAGDYLFANFDNEVKVIGRTNYAPAWPKHAVTTAVMVIVSHKGRQHKVSVHASDHSLRIDQKLTPLDTKKSIENKSAQISIVRDSADIYIVKAKSFRVQLSIKNAKTPNAYIDTTIFSSKSAADRVTGLCGKNKLVQKDENAFKNKRTIHKPIPNPKKYSKEEAKRFCARLPTVMARHFCEADYVIGGPQLAQSAYTVEKEKKKFRSFYRLSKQCRRAIRRHQYLKRHGRLAEAASFKKVVKKACAKKRRSTKCRKFQHEYRAQVARFNKDAPRLSPATRAAAQNSIRLFGERVQLACSRRARKNCRTSRAAAVSRIQKEITATQVKLSQLSSQLRAAQARKCRA